MSDLQKILFLDIDGPVIPSPCYFLDSSCSMRRSVVSSVAIGCINNFCDKTGALIVTNSAHNYHNTGIDIDGSHKDLKRDLMFHGILEAYFHQDWRTKFTLDDVERDHNRMEAITEWQSRNGEANWVCFDDLPFTADKRLVLIPFDEGITLVKMRLAMDVLGYKDNKILI